jgi:hypothetical protein
LPGREVAGGVAEERVSEELRDALCRRAVLDKGGCMLWVSSRAKQGYGVLRWNGRTKNAHRLAYELAKGPVPSGLELDHLCRNRACINPDHLEPVTHKENMRRGKYGALTECPRGHPYSGENLRLCRNGERKCRTCERAGVRRRRERARA